MNWDLFVRLFHVGVPWLLLMGLLVTCITAIIGIVRFRNTNKQNWIAGVWTAGYIIIILWITVLVRLDYASIDYSYNLMPFWSIDAIREGYVETIYEKVDNVILFVPLGCCLGLCKEPWWKAVCLGIATSIVIELLQLITRTGMCETDDVICNTAGCVVGLVFVRTLIYLLKNVQYLCKNYRY